MKLSLSTNWCCRRIESGEEIAEKALELGFAELELGFHTTETQVEGFRRRLDRIPVGSVHAFCPVPLSAPQGYPELYALASFDDEARAMARFQVKRNIAFAASMGADALVLHAGRVMCNGFSRRWNLKRRRTRGAKMTDVFKRELDALRPELERAKVTLALENLPYLEGYPAEWELKDVVGDWVRPWFDTGHDFVRRAAGWIPDSQPPASDLRPFGLHVSDSAGGDDHLAPGTGKVDFAALKPLAESARHIVFEPSFAVNENDLKKGIAHIRKVWES